MKTIQGQRMQELAGKTAFVTGAATMLVSAATMLVSEAEAVSTPFRSTLGGG